MDQDLADQMKRAARGTGKEPPREPLAEEWPGTGLCAQAQADGVPCPDPAASCDTCGRALERGPCLCGSKNGDAPAT